MDPPADPSLVRTLQAILGRELCRPLDRFEAGLARLLADPPRPLTDSEQQHARMMLQLCDELRALTRESLGVGDPDGGGPDPPT